MNEDKDYQDAMDVAIERGEVCTDCGCSIDHVSQRAPSQCKDCYGEDEAS